MRRNSPFKISWGHALSKEQNGMYWLYFRSLVEWICLTLIMYAYV
jgi:hypothetical protein